MSRFSNILKPLLLCLTLILSACDSDQSAPAAPVPDVKRPNLVVRDMERSLEIYRDILGLNASTVREGSAGSFSYPVFNVPPEASLRFASLHEPGEERVLNLTEVTGIDLPALPSGPHMSAIVIGISNLKPKFAKLESMGLKVTRTEIADGPDFSFIEQAFVDPDGHLIVCFEVIRE